MQQVYWLEKILRFGFWTAWLLLGYFQQQLHYFLAVWLLFTLWRFWYLYHLRARHYHFGTTKANRIGQHLRILHITDLHSHPNTRALRKIIQIYQPDLVVDTGDAVDEISNWAGLRRVLTCYRMIADAGLSLVRIEGNHDVKTSLGRYLRVLLSDLSLDYPHQTFSTLSKEQSQCSLHLRNCIIKLVNRHGVADTHPEHTLVLIHDPLELDQLQLTGHLVLAGHTHGGVIRLPGRTLYCPRQGFPPKYDAGRFIIKTPKNRATLIISRGIGYSTPALRLFCPPDVGIIDYQISQS